MSETTLTRRQALLAASGAAAAAVLAAGPAAAEYQPAMLAAVNALTNARASLVLATSDKGGHRLAAIALIDQAITQVQLGIQYDNTH